MAEPDLQLYFQFSFSVLLNGSPCQKFYPQQSPYLFILCAEVFSGLLNEAQAENGLHGIQIVRGAPKINHLFFADNSLIFCRYSFQDSQTIQEILNTYQSASGQLINLDNSEISFSRNVPDDHKILWLDAN